MMMPAHCPGHIGWPPARWVLLAAAIPALWACNARRLVKPQPAPSQTFSELYKQAVNRNIDIVFEVDNSVSMQPEQANLATNFPAFINILKKVPGGLPNVHIAVVTSNMGAGAFSSQIMGCENPDNGSFVDQSRFATDPVCATAKLNAGQHFIESLNGGAQNNFGGNITDVFRCIAQVGTDGCGFEDHLESVRAALGDETGNPGHDIPVRPIPPNNEGFLRSDAYLAVILITNEEECSSAPDNVLYDSTNNAPAALGPLLDRCFAHTDICDGQRVINYVNAGTPVGPFQNCVSDETTFNSDPTHGAIPVQFYIDYFNHLKSDSSKILLSGIIAPPGPYSLVLVPDQQGGMVLAQGNSCTGAAGVFGQPTPRLTKFFGAFPPQQVVTTSICDQSFAAAMQRIAEAISTRIGSPCVVGKVLDANGAVWTPTATTLPDCVVIDHQTNASGVVVDTTLPPCPVSQTTGTTACWHLDAGGMTCPGDFAMGFSRPGAALPTDLNSSISCSVLACPPAGTANPPPGC